jgi:hypothetical protein
MQTRGKRIALDRGAAALLAGDGIFYGGARGTVASHVVAYLDRGRIFTFGATPPTITAYATYWTNGRRADIGARRWIPG